MGPCLGPLFGGWIAEKAGWRWMCTEILVVIQSRCSHLLVDWVLFIFTGVCFIFTLFIPETLASILLRRKAEKLRKSTGDESYRTLEELERVPFFETLKISLLRPIVMLVAEPIVALFSLCGSLRNCFLLYTDIFTSADLSFIYSLLCTFMPSIRISVSKLPYRPIFLRIPHCL